MKRIFGITTVLLFVTTLLSGAAWAAEEEPVIDPGTGVVYVKLTADYAVPYKKGEKWERYEEHEFLRNGKQLVIEGCMRDEEYSFELRPMEEDKYEVFLLEVTPGCWALKKVKGKRRVKEWRCDLTARFVRKSSKPKPVEPEDTPDDPGFDPDVPPMPGVPPPPPPKEDE